VLPSLVLMTDDTRLADPLAAASALPRGSMVVVRACDAKRRDALARAMLKRARTGGLAILVADDPLLAARLGADGFHLPEVRAGEATHWHARFPDFTITAAAHSAHALMRARLLPIDAFFLSPVFATASHTERAALTPLRASMIAKAAGKPVYALGGIDARSARRLIGFAGIAAIGALAV
jgi:thiamine-phosphate pyrophosphorylase